MVDLLKCRQVVYVDMAVKYTLRLDLKPLAGKGDLRKEVRIAVLDDIANKLYRERLDILS